MEAAGLVPKRGLQDKSSRYQGRGRKTGRLPGRCLFLQGCESLQGRPGNSACSRRVQTARATLRSHAQQRCHRGIWAVSGAWSRGELARWEGLLLNPSPVGFSNLSRLWLIFELSVTDWASQCHIFLNMHKAMESFHRTHDTLSSGTLGTALAS